MFLKSIFSLIFFLQYLSPIPAKRSIIEVLHANQDVATFTQFIKTDGLFRTFQQYGPVAFLSPINGHFEYSLESPFGNRADEYLVNQAHLNLLTIGSRPAIGRHLLEYQIVNGTCSTHAYNNETVRFGTYVYSKDTSFVVQQVNDTKYSSLKAVSSDSWLTNRVIHVLEKSAFTDGLPLLLKTVAFKLVNEKNTSLLYEYNLGPLLNSAIHYTTRLFPNGEEGLVKDVLVPSALSNNAMSIVNDIMDLGFMKVLQRSFHRLSDSRFFEKHLKPTMNFLFSLSKRIGLSDFSETTNMIINHIPNSTGIFESVTSQNEMKQISQETTLSLLTCPKEILDLKHDVCLNEPRFNDISFNDLQSNEFCFRIMSALSKVELFCMVPKAQSQSLEYDMLVPSLEIIIRPTFFSRLTKCISWILEVFRCFFGFITHLRFVSGLLSSLVLRPALLSWTQKTLERREQQVMAERAYWLQQRQNWIAMRSSAPNTLSP